MGGKERAEEGAGGEELTILALPLLLCDLWQAPPLWAVALSLWIGKAQ